MVVINKYCLVGDHSLFLLPENDQRGTIHSTKRTHLVDLCRKVIKGFNGYCARVQYSGGPAPLFSGRHSQRSSDIATRPVTF